MHTQYRVRAEVHRTRSHTIGQRLAPRLQLSVQWSAAQRPRDVLLAGAELLGTRQVEQWAVESKSTEMEAALLLRSVRGHCTRSRPSQCIALEPPQEDTHIRNVVFATRIVDAT